MIVTVLTTFFLSNCSVENPAAKSTISTTPQNDINLHYLALGDSYTIGQSVCSTCKFPEQLKYQLANHPQNQNYSLDVIARTGWTTSNLINAIKDQSPSTDYDLVSLLIGVNNQFQGIDFSIYEKEFPELIAKSISLAKGNKKRVIVLSIPDYAYTPFGQNYRNPENTSIEIDRYNTFAKKYCEDNAITFVNITDITRNGLEDPSLVANDGLHPSVTAYKLFVERLFPHAIMAFKVE